MMVNSSGRFLSRQFKILTTANRYSLDEYLTDKFNTSNNNAQRNDSIKSSIFADNLRNTNPNQPHSKKETYDGSYVQNDDNAKARDGIIRITTRETVLNPVSMNFSYTYDNTLTLLLSWGGGFTPTKFNFEFHKFG